MLNNVEWGEFRLGDLFDVDSWVYGKNKKYDTELKEFTRKSIAVISGVTENNGTNFYTEDALSEDEIFEKELTISTRGEYSGTVFYHNEKFVLANNVLVMKMPNLSKNKKRFIGSLINSLPYGGYSGYPRKETLKEDKIQLPTQNSKIDFEFMESFIVELGNERIVELEAGRLAELEAYLLTTGLKDYTLTAEEQQALDDFENHKIIWREFRIEDVLIWQQKIAELNPLHLDSLTLTDEKKYPFYGQATVNNGIIEYRHLVDDVLNNKKGKSTILIHSNNQNTVYLETPFYLKDGHGATSVLQSDYLNKLNALFFISSIKKVILTKYSYNAKATKIELKNTLIYLPVQNVKPDYSIMETLISAIQKLVIKEVVLYADRKIAATKTVIGL